MNGHLAEAFTIANVRAVLPDRVLDRAAVTVAGGWITAIERAPVTSSVIDGDGAYLMPGIIDLHNDHLEMEVNPRPEANLPLEHAFANLEHHLLSAGVTTEFHAVAFMSMGAKRRTLEGGLARARFIATCQQTGQSGLDHQVLHRIDVWNPESLDAVFSSIRDLPVRYLSLNDHTPGQGQYRDLAKHLDRLALYSAQRGSDPVTEADLRQRMAERAADTSTVPAVYRRIAEELRRTPGIVASHDDDSPEKVDLMADLGATVAEFPITIEAARRARERGMAIVVGAPNIVRGGSTSGNADAGELYALGLADILCADYHAPALLPAAFTLASTAAGGLPAAIRTITLNPARAVGLLDRGAIRVGARADLLLVQNDQSGLPHVQAVFVNGRLVRYQSEGRNGERRRAKGVSASGPERSIVPGSAAARSGDDVPELVRALALACARN